MHYSIALFFLFSCFSPLFGSEKNILIIQSIAPWRRPFREDGFIAATRLLSKEYTLIYYDTLSRTHTHNTDFTKPCHCAFDLQSIDAVIYKSNWVGCMKYKPRELADVPKAIAISCPIPPPKRIDLSQYDVLFYETEWYKQYIKSHPCAIHAFGVNTEMMKPPEEEVEKIYDTITPCKISKHKSLFHLASLPGKHLVIGFPADQKVMQQLRKEGIVLKREVHPQELVKYYHQSGCCLLPYTVRQGGERAVLEARACGIPVVIDPKNEKLRELLEGPLYDHSYYARQLKKGIEYMLQKGATQ